MQNIIESSSIEKSFKIILHVMWNCNFRCHYCADEHNFWWEKINLEHIEDIKLLLSKVKKSKKYSDLEIFIDLTWWEPFLNEDIFQIVNDFSSIDENIKIQITTNWYLIPNLKDKLLNIKNKNIIINISIHYFYYIKFPQKIIEIIEILEEYKIDFLLKFLLPDLWTSLKDFLSFKDFIVNSLFKINIENKISYSLIIIHNTWEISNSYLWEILDFYEYKNSWKKNNYIEIESKISRENQLVNLTFEDWITKKVWFWEMFQKQYNKFRWYKCYYINTDFISLQIFEDWTVELGWCCKTLWYMKFRVKDLDNLLFNWDKYVECHSKSCTMDLCLTLKKQKYTKLNIYRLLELKLNDILKKINELQDKFIFLKSELVEDKSYFKLFFLYKGDYVCCTIKRENTLEYLYDFHIFDNWLNYYLSFPNKNFNFSDIKNLFTFLLKYNIIILKLINKYGK